MEANGSLPVMNSLPVIFFISQSAVFEDEHDASIMSMAAISGVSNFIIGSSGFLDCVKFRKQYIKNGN